MYEKKTSVFENGLIWFGAAVSIAEILTGTFIAPLGFRNGVAAILLGHLIGCTLLCFAGLIGAQTEISAMETVKISFGRKGALLFAALNVLQLVGWTAIMIKSGASGAACIYNLGGDWFWCCVIGMLIIVWIAVGVKSMGKLNLAAMGALLILSIILSAIVFKGKIGAPASGGISFGAAVELAAAMPISWLPLISDYTRLAERKTAAAVCSAAVYFLTSSWMFIIGMGAALFTGESDVAKIMVAAGLGLAGILIIILATVTTTFLDALSAGVSAVSIFGKLNEKRAAVTVCVLGAVLAIFAPVERFEAFLYMIGSVFAPMVSILITDYFILKKDSSVRDFNIANLALWAFGFALYRVFMRVDTPVGSTAPVMLITALLCIVVNKIGGKIHV